MRRQTVRRGNKVQIQVQQIMKQPKMIVSGLKLCFWGSYGFGFVVYLRLQIFFSVVIIVRRVRCKNFLTCVCHIYKLGIFVLPTVVRHGCCHYFLPSHLSALAGTFIMHFGIVCVCVCVCVSHAFVYE